MALTAITVGAVDHLKPLSGVKSLKIWEQVSEGSDAVTFTISGRSLTGADIPTGANAALITFKKQSAKMAVNIAPEKGLSMVTATIEGYIPKIDRATLDAYQLLVGKALMGAVSTYESSEAYLLGWDGVLGSTYDDSSTDRYYSDFALFLESIEIDSGAALGDESGATLKFTAVQGEVPYSFTEA